MWGGCGVALITGGGCRLNLTSRGGEGGIVGGPWDGTPGRKGGGLVGYIVGGKVIFVG